MFTPAHDAIEAARVAELEARRAQGDAAKRLFVEAAKGYAEAGRHVLAAVAFAQAEDARDERRAWERVLRDPRLRGQPYEAGAGPLQLRAGAARRDGDKDAAATATWCSRSACSRRSPTTSRPRGERERAFDCYEILLKLGKDSGSYENLAEGYVNCIRVLKEDNLKFYVLQYYEDFLALASSARSSTRRRRCTARPPTTRGASGCIYDRDYMQARRRDLVARGGEERARRRAGRDDRERLPRRRSTPSTRSATSSTCASPTSGCRSSSSARRSSKRYADVVGALRRGVAGGDRAAPFPDYLRQQHAYAEIWFLDLIEWELDGDPSRCAPASSATCATPT